MEFDWTERQRARYQDTLTAVREAFADDADETSAEVTAGYYDRKDWLLLGQLGLLGLSVPEGYGGGGFGALDTALQVEALGRGCARTGLVFGASAHLFACAMPIVDFGSEELKRRVLPGMCRGELIAGNAMTEDEAGSDVSRLAVTARRVEGGWVLDGEKSFVSNGPAADVYVTYATTDPKAGHLGVTGFVVDRTAAGVTAGEPMAKMGLSQCPAGTVRFDGCFVPDSDVLGEPGQGGFIFQHSMGWERACLFAGYVGLADRLIDLSVAHVRSRRQFGRRISEFQAVSHRIADMKLRVESARLLLYRACWEMDERRPATLAIALSKLAVSEGVVTAALDAVRLFGGRGYLRAGRIEAALRDAVPAVIFSGTSDIQRELIARELGI
ncbi:MULTISPECIES: acyl-CoA dehydrogenase family protein [unclassified Streptomyces]|uniref:acyl-CoA dehydrogenase family protein n=1 Tax=unclassified Streptomyces TaxID=2593676 RepID=UPI0022B604CD|nr:MULTISPECIES: acyl-CoA dehydrogenase family protein [unclassified Streptomyces]MCZ7416215.1 acyl-CoA dehydrogenase family protein [Streptomyces sp. WMMC897]MCZ7433976.1 acyl-CoA dehydrogenase family protein [Streptomyces sp. WMMC1477]